MRYDTKMLCKIPQIDATLVLKKTESTKALFGFASDFTEYGRTFIGKYEDEGIFKSHATFLDDIDELKKRADKLFGATVVWDADALIKAFMSGKREEITEKSDNLKISVEAVIERIELCRCDENGKLLTPPADTDMDDDEELAAQPECGRTVSGNFAPIDKFKKIWTLIDALDLDEAAELAKKESKIYYNEYINIEIKKLIWILRMGEFEKAGDAANALIEAAQKHNETVESQTEEVKPRILVVDDVPDMLLTIKSILYDLYHVCTVTNYISALRFLENCHADLILLDIGLHEVDGFELLAKIREIQKYRSTPVLFLTGNVSKEDILRAIDSGISDYLRKPIDASLLISRVQKNLADWKPPQHTA